MYNEELKRRFMDEVITGVGRRQTTEGFFNRLEQDELNWGADICTRSKEEALPAVTKLCGVRGRTTAMVLPILQSYARWCITSNVPGATDGLLQIKEVGTDKMKTHLVSGPVHLRHYLNSVFDPEDMLTIDLIYRCFYWLAFAGVEEGDVTGILASAVDLENKSLSYEGRTIAFCDEAMKTVELCVKQNEFLCIRPNSEKMRTRNGRGFLLCGFRGTSNLSSMRVEASKKQKAQKYRDVLDPDHTDTRLDLQPSYFRVWISGLFYRAYLKECAGKDVSFDAEVAWSMQKRNYSFTKASGYTETTMAKKLCVEYEKDYLRWKEAFSL